MRVHFGTSQLRHCVSIRQRDLPYLLRHERTSKARIPYSTGEVLNYVAVSEDSGRPNSSARESALEAAGRGSVGLAAEVLVEHLLEHALLRCRPGEQRHRRPELLGVARAEDGDSVRPGQIGKDACTLHEPGPQDGVRAEGRALGQ